MITGMDRGSSIISLHGLQSSRCDSPRRLERRTGENQKKPRLRWPRIRTQGPPIVGAKRVNKKPSPSSGASGSRESSPSSSDSDVDRNQVPETIQKPYAAAVGKGHGAIAKVVDGRAEIGSLWPGRPVTKTTTHAKPVAAGVNLTRGGKAAVHISGQNLEMALATGPWGKGKIVADGNGYISGSMKTGFEESESGSFRVKGGKAFMEVPPKTTMIAIGQTKDGEPMKLTGSVQGKGDVLGHAGNGELPEPKW